jgi:uncharacterized membrane protein YdfJ with MMPL/SSD domain
VVIVRCPKKETHMLLNDSMSNLDKAMKIAGFAGMVISITVALFLIFSASAPQSKTAVLLFSFGAAVALSYLSFAIKPKSRK